MSRGWSRVLTDKSHKSQSVCLLSGHNIADEICAEMSCFFGLLEQDERPPSVPLQEDLLESTTRLLPRRPAAPQLLSCGAMWQTEHLHHLTSAWGGSFTLRSATERTDTPYHWETGTSGLPVVRRTATGTGVDV